MAYSNHMTAAAARDMAQLLPHANFLGLPFCLLASRDVLRLIVERGRAPYGYVVTPNAYHVVAAHDQPGSLLPIYRGAWLSLCDSRILRALARLDGRRLPLVTGSDLAADLLAALDGCAELATVRRLLIVGPARSAEPALRAAYPRLALEVMPAQAELAQHPARRLAVAQQCLARQAGDRPWDILLLCVGCPAQEQIAMLLAELGCRNGTALCVGAAVDFLSGVRVRAPRWVQQLALEWAYRLLQEPTRLWRRYLLESPRILHIFMRQRAARSR